MHKLVPYVRRRPETVIKDRFEQIEQEFAFVLKPVGVLTICTEISVGENFPVNDTDIGFYHLQKNFRKVPLESKWNILFGKFLEGTS